MKKKTVNRVIFQDFSEVEISEVINLAEVVSYSTGSILFNRDDASNYFYIISTGELEVFSPENGKEIPIATIKSGSVVGEIGFLDGQARTASARAISDIVALKISKEVFSDMEKTNVRLAIKLIQEIEIILADRLRNSDKLLVDYQVVKINDQFLQSLDAKSQNFI